MTPPSQKPLFIDPSEPCTVCAGTGTDDHTDTIRACPSCKGTGLRVDQYDPETANVPY